MPTTYSTPLDIQAALEDTDSSKEVQAEIFNRLLCGATSAPDSDLSHLPTSSCNIMKEAYASINSRGAPWNPFLLDDERCSLIISHLAVIPSANDPLAFHLHLVSLSQPPTQNAPQSSSNDNPPSLTGVSGLHAFTRATDLGPQDFLDGDIEFHSLHYQVPITEMIAVSASIPSQLKKELKKTYGAGLYSKMVNTSHARSSIRRTNAIASASPSRTRSETSINLPLLWPLPIGHTITSATPIPLPSTPLEIKAFLQTEQCLDSDWLLSDPLFIIWLSAVSKQPQHFSPSQSTNFAINESQTLQHYQAAIASARLILSDFLVGQALPALMTAIALDRSILTQQTFPPSTIPVTDYKPDLFQDLPWMPPFLFEALPQTTPPASPPRQPFQQPQTTIANRYSPAPSIPPTRPPFSLAHQLPPLPPIMHRTPPVILRWSTLLACHHHERTRTLNPSSLSQHNFPPSGPSFGMALPSGSSDGLPHHLLSYLVLPPLHEAFDAAIRCKSPIDAANHLRSRFQLSQTSPHSNIVSKNLQHCTSDAFFTEPVWTDIISGTFSSTPLSDIPYPGFSIINTLLLDPSNSPGPSKKHPLINHRGFPHYTDIQKFLAGCKWFLLSVVDPHFIDSSILFTGIIHIEQSLERLNLPARWSSSSTQATASYQILELVHNLFSLLGSLASNSSLNSIIPVTVCTDPIAIPMSAHLIPSSLQDRTLFLDLDSSLATWKISCDDVFRELSGSSGSLHHLLLSSQQASFRHFLFDNPIPKRPRFEDAPSIHEEHPPKRAKTPSKKPQKALPGKAVIQPTASHTLASILSLHNEGKISEPSLPKMKKIRNENGVPLCLPFLLGAECSRDSACGYHLQAVPPDHLPGSSRSDFSVFHAWVQQNSQYISLTPTAANNSKLRL